MKIKLVSLKLTNFKKLRNHKVEFGQVTNIYGDNATGKTTLIDAYLWLFFGKDSTDRKDFEIKTLDENNDHYHKLDHEVEAVILVNGEENTLRRCFREKWTKKKGSTESEFTGHETTYFWNEVPKSMAEFNAKVSSLIDESIFKLISNTIYFNSLKWQDRRTVLTQIAGVINDVDVANGNPAFLALLESIKGKKSLEEYRKEIVQKKKKLRDELELLPSKIAEAKRALPDDVDYAAIEKQIAELEDHINSIDAMLQSKSEAYQTYEKERTNWISLKQDVVVKRMQLENNIKTSIQAGASERQQAINAKSFELTSKQNERTAHLNEWNNLDAKIKQLEKQVLSNDQKVTSFRENWNVENAKLFTIDSNALCCPTCKRELEADDVEAKKKEMEGNFNKDKSDKLTKISTEATAINEETARIKNEIADLKVKLDNVAASGVKVKNEIEVITNSIRELQEQHNRLIADEAGQLQTKIAESAEYKKYSEDIAALETKINEPYQAEDNSGLKLRKNDLNKQVIELRTQLATKETRTRQLARIEELEGQESTMAQELAEMEGVEFTITAFEKARMDELENRINGRFQLVKFKLFQTNINGGEEPCCITLVNGVPYPDVNTAGKIQAGIDIINTLSQHYGVEAPVWVDNRESVVKLPETHLQLINLIVSEPDKKLRVETASPIMAKAGTLFN